MLYNISFTFEYCFDASGYECHRIETRTYSNLNETHFKDTLTLLLHEKGILEIEVKTS